MWWLLIGVLALLAVTEAANRWFIAVSRWNQRVRALLRSDPDAAALMHESPPLYVRAFNRIN